MVETTADVEDALRSGNAPARLLHDIWAQREPVPDRLASQGAKKTSVRQIGWLQDNVRLARRFTTSALRQEEFLLVCDAASEILRLWDDVSEQDRLELVRVRMDYAAALTRLGATRAARRELEQCIGDSFLPRLGAELKADVLIQLGNVLREESHFAAVRAMRLQLAEEALGFYRRALDLTPERLEAVLLVAAASLIIGEEGSSMWSEARSLASQILTLVNGIERTDGERFSTVFSRAIAYAILGKLEESAAAYGRLANIEGVTTSELAEARYRAQFLAEAVGKDRKYFNPAFPPLQLIVFVGHQPDLDAAPDHQQRFSTARIDGVRALLAEKLEAMGARAGLASCCAGGDLLFAEALLARQGTLHLVLPWSRADFRANRIVPFDGPGPAPRWTPLFDTALETASTVRELGQMYEPGSDITWQYMTEVTAGIALNTARTSRLDIQPMALWDGLPGRRVGGTESFVEFWRQQVGIEPAIIDLPSLLEGRRGRAHEISVARCEEFTMKQQVKSILFADIVGYSKLNERVIPEFINVFLERVSRLISESRNAPLSVNTWGDAVYAVFDFAHQAGAFALELTQMIQENEADWIQKGLFWEEATGGAAGAVQVHPLNIRVGLHTGPVFIQYDPIVRRLGFTGAHVNRAARIEPVTKPGEVYASEEFAALAELDLEIERKSHAGNGDTQRTGFSCEYAGTMPLAKKFPGRHRIYRVLPKKPFGLEDLARAAHEAYCLEAKARGETLATNSTIQPWETLPEDLRDANRAQVADIPNKLQFLGYELAPGHGLHPSAIVISDAQLEHLSFREHGRWMKDRLRRGWTYGPQKDAARKEHPMLIPWEKLSEEEKEKDRDTVRHVPKLVEKAGFRIRKIDA